MEEKGVKQKEIVEKWNKRKEKWNQKKERSGRKLRREGEKGRNGGKRCGNDIGKKRREENWKKEG